MSWSDSISTTLTDPTVNALLGMTAGFGQAAMPSRLPVPFGAALGLAAGGLASGARSAYASQLAQQQAEAARINNQRANLLFQYFGKNFTGQGGTTPAASDAAAGAAGGSGAPMGVPNVNGNYLLSPSELVSRGDLAMMTGQDRAAAQLYGMPNTMAGGAGYSMSPTGVAFATPNGRYDPSVITRNTLAEKVPAANVALQEKYATPGEQPGGVYGTPAQTLGGAPQIGGGTAPGAVPGVAAPGVVPPDPFPTIAARINGNENPTGNAAATNPASSAAGNGQFLNGTWPGVLRSVRPDLTAGRSDADLMALRSNPQLALDATSAYARQNAGALAQAGFPVTPGTIYMAHGLGPQGAMSVLRATPSTPVAAVLPAQVIAANPYLQGKNAGDVRSYFDQKMQGIDAGQPRPVAPGITQRTGPTGAVTTTNTFPVQQKLFESDMKDLETATEDATHIQQNMTRLYDMRDLAKQLTQSGFGGETRSSIANFVDTYVKSIPGMGNAAKSFLDSALNLPPAELAQQFAKLNLQAAGMQEREAVGARGGYRLTELYKQANPSIGIQPTANVDIANLQLVAHQMDLDYLRGLHDHVVSNGQQFSTGQANYVPAAQFDKQWVAQDNPKIYLAATYALSGKPFDTWAKLLGGDKNPDKLKAAIDVVHRVDPSAQIMWQDGQPHVFASGGG